MVCVVVCLFSLSDYAFFKGVTGNLNFFENCFKEPVTGTMTTAVSGRLHGNEELKMKNVKKVQPQYRNVLGVL